MMSESKTPTKEELERSALGWGSPLLKRGGLLLLMNGMLSEVSGAEDYIGDGPLSTAFRDKLESVVIGLERERDALAARVEKAEKDAGRWRFVRSKVSRILNETTLKMDGLRVEVYYDEPQAFVILPTDNGALFDEAIDAALSREEKS